MRRTYNNVAIDAGLRIERTQPIAPQIYAALRQRIVDNRLPPGAVLSETVLAAQFDISRTPLRAAMQQLAAEGLIETRPQVGSVVAPLDLGRLEEAVLVRSALEEAVVRKLAERHAAARDLSHSLEAQERLAVRDDYAGFFREDEAFHERLAALAGLPNVWRLVQSVKGHVDRQRYRLMSGIPMRSQRAYQDHCKILAHILAGNADAAAMAMRAHVESVLEIQPPSGAADNGGPAADH